MTLRPWLILALVLLLPACSNIGPKTVPRDRFDYNSAISNSWKEQTLLNIVKLRYADMPLFVEVASIVSGYTLEGTVNLGGTATTNRAAGDFFSVGGSSKYTDRPTITYAPITGAKFNESFMTPIPPKAVLFLLQSGWPADLIFPLVVDSVNGLRSEQAAGTGQRQGDSNYYLLVNMLRVVQKNGALGMRIVKEEDKKESTVLFFHKKNVSPQILASLQEINRLLELDPDRAETKVTYGLLPRSNQEIAMITRSTLQIMINLATQIDVPPEHVTKGWTVPSLVSEENASERATRLIRIHAGIEPPADAFTAVKYEGHWFWIDPGDFKSKRTFAFLMILFSLMETGGGQGLPLVTIPAG